MLDPDECPECARRGRVERVNTAVRHLRRNGCIRMWWCFVCGSGGGEVVECPDHPIDRANDGTVQ